MPLKKVLNNLRIIYLPTKLLPAHVAQLYLSSFDAIFALPESVIVMAL